MIRKVKRQISREGLISRVPGFFPYLDPSDGSIHKATDAPSGCYNHIPLNLWDDCFEPLFGPYKPYKPYKKETGVPYRIVMDAFYTLKRGEEYKRTVTPVPSDAVEEDDETLPEESDGNKYVIKPDDEGVEEFLELIEDGIGKVLVPKSIREDADLVPEYIYLVQVPMLVDEYRSKSILCEFYRQLTEIHEGDTDEVKKTKLEERNAAICCVCDKYKRMGGDNMLAWLKTQLAEVAFRADRWMERKKQSPTINFGVNLSLHSLDMGVVRPAIVDWKAGEYYYKGQIVYFEGDLYLTTKDCDSDWWDPAKREYTFNDKTWEDEKGKSIPFLLPIEKYSDNRKDGYEESGNEEGETIIYQTNSKLKTCRRPQPYINAFGVEERPADGEDWLYFYRVGQPVNIEYEADALGNLVTTDGKKPNIDNLLIYGDLIIDISRNTEEKTLTFRYVIGARLKLKNDDGIVTGEDDDRNPIYRISNDAEYEPIKGTGVCYEETYTYNDEDTVDLVKNEAEFSEYKEGEVNDIYAKYPFITTNSKYQYKLECGMEGVMVSGVRSQSIDNPNRNIPFSYGVSEKDIERILGIDEGVDEDTKKEVLAKYHLNVAHLNTVPYIRDDYNLGVGYSEKVESDVFIRRGMTNVFERHFKLAEIKTLEDMENYANGGFFNMQSS